MNNNVMEIARSKNMEVANLKDWQLYKTRHGMELREAARKAIDNPIICTAGEFGEMFGDLFPNHAKWDAVADCAPEDLFVWCFHVSHIKTKRRDICVYALAKVD